MMRLFFLLTLCLTLCANFSNAQEICNNNLDDDGDGLVDCLDGECGSKICEICDNGTDDDGDGFIDCYDKECTLNNACDGFFLGGERQCDVRPDVFPPFEMKLKFKSLPNQTNHLNRIIAGDIDGDGMPELATAYAATIHSGGPTTQVTGITASKINIFQSPVMGTTLNLDRSIDVSMGGLEAVAYDDIAMADINGDHCAEIFVVTKNLSNAPNANYKIVAYDCNGTQVWATPISFSFNPGLIGLADFDQDGLVELYSRTQIFDAHSGVLLGYHNIDDVNTGIHAGVNLGWGMNSNASVAVDILPANPGLELVAGCRIYGVAINRGTMTATLSLLKEVSSYATRTSSSTSSPTSVADFNKDGYLDVLAVGSDGSYNNNTTIFFWDVQNNVVKKFIDRVTSDSRYTNGWQNGAGRINIADIDGDTLMNAVYVSGRYLYALQEGPTGLQLRWRQDIIDETSGFTGCTVFDFNGDGRVEIVYRDEDYLYVYQTLPDGVLVRSAPIRCSSRSHAEYPTVVDVDGDGAAELCVTCSTSNTVSGKNLGFWDEAELRVYESANEPWVPARTVANQHAYFVTNINDDLTIPRYQQQPHLVYANKSPCNKYGTSRPLNSFMNQVPFLDPSGCISYPTPDLAAVPFSSMQSIGYTPLTCLEDSIQISFKYTNRGTSPVWTYPGVNISFYNGDPQLVNRVEGWLGTQSFVVSTINPGDTITVTTKIKKPENSFDLFISIDDDGWGESQIRECGEGNIISGRIESNPVLLRAELVKDNLSCLGAPNNGAAKAYVSTGALLDSANFNFFWTHGARVDIGSADHVGHVYENLGAGVYTLIAQHKTLSCTSDTATLSVNDISATVDARIILEQGLEPNTYPDAILRAVVNDLDHDGVGDPPANFRYAWYNGMEVFTGDTLGISEVLTGLDAGDYAVVVSDKVTGCYGSAFTTISPNPFDCPSFPAPDFVPVAGSLAYTPFTCLDDQIGISVQYTNQGNVVATGTIQISFYNGDPQLPQAVLLDTKAVVLSDLLPGGTATTTTYINNPGSEFDLYVVLNDDGTTSPLNLVNQSGRIAECTNNNVINLHIAPQIVTLVPELVRDNHTCVTAPGLPQAPDNGVVKAYVSIGNAKDSINFDFYWSNGSTTNPNGADYMGQAYSGLASGPYTVYAVHKTLHCASDTATIVVNDIGGSVEASVIQTQDFDNVNQPNGALKVVVNDTDHNGVGDPENNFQYEWYAGQEVLVGQTLGTRSNLTGLGAGTYSVLVFDPSNGCYDSAYATIVRKEIILGAEENDLTGISLYPNPGTEDFAIIIDNGYVGSVQVQLLSMTGTEVARVTNHKNSKTLKVSVDTHRFKSGVYLVKISLGKETLIKKWTKL